MGWGDRRGETAKVQNLLGAVREARLVGDECSFESAVSDSGIEVYGFAVDRSRAWDAWIVLRERHGDSGWYPFVTRCGPMEVVKDDRVGGPWGGGNRQLLKKAMTRDPEKVMAEIVYSRFREMADIYIPPKSDADRRVIKELQQLFDEQHTALALRPKYDRAVAGNFRRAATAGRGLWLNFVRAQAGFEIPALLPSLIQTPNWSGFPDDRELRPVDHVAILRHWNNVYGADFYYADSKALELFVNSPPLDPNSAGKVAVEQYAYCPDEVPDPETAGDGQVRSTVWSFWWD